MSVAVPGTFHDGQVVLETPVDWPEGAKVEVVLVGLEQPLGMTEEEWPTDPEGIAKLIARMDEIEPLEFTPEGEADLAAWRKKMKEYDIAKTQQRIERLFP
jgi:hypothetical protein